MSRSYATKHGMGFLKWACNKEDIDPSIVDTTNEPNPWQGSLQFGKLSIPELHERVQRDADELNIDKKINLVYTHLNYTDGKLATKDLTTISTNSKNGFTPIEKPDWCNHVYGSDAKDFMDILM